jgi:hypothetical protein
MKLKTIFQKIIKYSHKINNNNNNTSKNRKMRCKKLMSQKIIIIVKIIRITYLLTGKMWFVLI